jgi:hypothetical protein
MINRVSDMTYLRMGCRECEDFLYRRVLLHGLLDFKR